MTLDLSDIEIGAFATLLRHTIDDDRYPLSPRVQLLKGILVLARAGTSAAIAAKGVRAAAHRRETAARVRPNAHFILRADDHLTGDTRR